MGKRTIWRLALQNCKQYTYIHAYVHIFIRIICAQIYSRQHCWHAVVMLLTFVCTFLVSVFTCVWCSTFCCQLRVQIKMSSFTWLMMPINLSNMHWALLAGHVPTQTVSVVDSLSLHEGKKFINRWRSRVLLVCLVHFCRVLYAYCQWYFQ